MTPGTVAGLLRARAEAEADAVGLVTLEDRAPASWTWSDYWRRAEDAARGLRDAGIGAGDHVLMLVLDVRAAVACLFGCWILGAVPIQVGLPHRLDDLEGFVEGLADTARRVDAAAILVSQLVAAGAADAVLPVPVLVAEDMVAGGSDQSLPDPDDASAPALVQLTSGSTGRPRGVVIPHDRLLLHLEAISTALPLAGEGAACVTWLPLHHDMGLIGGLLYPLFNAFPVHLLSPLEFRRDPGIWMRTIATTRATCTPGPPAAYAIAKRLAPRAVAEGLDLSTLACAMIGAEPIPAALLRDFSAAYAPCGFRPEAFFPVYGLAEATVAVTFPRLLAPTVVDALDRDTLERSGVARPSARSDAVEYVGVGAPLPGTELRVVAADGRACSEREVGEILVRAPTLFSGYLGEPDATAAQVHDGWLHTGDLGYLAGGSLFVTGRVKEVIIKAGQNIYPAIIEELVAAIEGVRGVAAVGVPAPEQGTELVCVVAETRLPEEEHAALAARIRHALRDRGIVADRVALVRSGGLPKTTSGKIRRLHLAEAVASGRL